MTMGELAKLFNEEYKTAKINDYKASQLIQKVCDRHKK